MNIPQIVITRQDAEIEVRSRRAKIEMSSHRPHFRLRKNAARMHIDRRLPQMHVDRTQAAAMFGTAPVLQMNRQNFLNARQKVLGNIASMSAEGTALMSIENGGNSLADIAAQAMEEGTGVLNISALPKPDINWESGYLNINWTPGNIDLEWDVSSWVDIRVEPHYVEIRMVKYPEIKITVKYKQDGRRAGGKFVDRYL